MLSIFKGYNMPKGLNNGLRCSIFGYLIVFFLFSCSEVEKTRDKIVEKNQVYSEDAYLALRDARSLDNANLSISQLLK